MNEIIYKHLTTKDEVEQCYRLTAEVRDINHWLGGGVIPPIIVEYAKKRCLIVAKDKDKVVGFVQFNTRKDRTSVIYHYCVHPDYRGQHIGSTLCKKVPPPTGSEVYARQ